MPPHNPPLFRPYSIRDLFHFPLQAHYGVRLFFAFKSYTMKNERRDTMYVSHKIRWVPLCVSLAISLGIGALSGFLVRNSTSVYQSLKLPKLAPPPQVFPIVWTILYILMGISAYLVYEAVADCRRPALTVYAVQLAVNFVWSLIFFNMKAYLFVFLWLVLLWTLVIVMIGLFSRCSKTAAVLQIPYLLWITFAGYLNLGVWILNR